MRELRSEIDIGASAARVWAILTDFDSYPEWNPFILELKGELREGAQLSVKIQPPGRKAMTFRPTVRAVEPERELRWLGKLMVASSMGSTPTCSSRSREGPDTCRASASPVSWFPSPVGC